MASLVDEKLTSPGDKRFELPDRVGRDLAANVAVGVCEVDGDVTGNDGKLVLDACPSPARNPLAGSRRYRARLFMH
jgi:hypothetical protein